MKKVILCTSNDHRHKYVANTLATLFPSLKVFYEKSKMVGNTAHFTERYEVEKEMLEFDQLKALDQTVIDKGQLNDVTIIDLINRFCPEFIITYGCSIISDYFLETILAKKINVHLGLSPYYRGTGTNFWPVYNGEMEFCGVTFHKLTSQIDGGKILGQYTIEKKLYPSIHHMGNSLIRQIPKNLSKIINTFDTLGPLEQSSCFFNDTPRYYFRKSDFSEIKGKEVKKNFNTVNEIFLKSDIEAKHLKI